MEIKQLHKWDLSFAAAAELQRQLAGQVQFIPLNRDIRTVAGIDCALSKDGQKIIACIVALNWPGLETIEVTNAIRKLKFPYVPGLLSFREGPVCIAAIKKLKQAPDVFLVDGQGIAHPRRLGLATHLGLFLDRPTIGCAKSRLTGTYQTPAAEKGSYCLLKDKGQTIGAVVRTRTNVKPMFISVGNKCLLEDAIRITLACAIKYRLPEPTRLAHQQVGKLKQSNQLT